jgi:hypothetical protein
MKQPPKKKSERKKSPKSLTGKVLTKKLKELAMDVVSSTLNSDGSVNMVTRSELLAEEIWNAACGIKIDPENGTHTLTHNPIPWAVQTVFERLDGKVVPRAQDRTNRPALGVRIDEQQKLKMKSLRNND